MFFKSSNPICFWDKYFVIDKLSTLTSFCIWISTGANSFISSVAELFNAKALEKIQIVKKSIKQITVVESTVVLILLLICLTVKLFKFLK